jgi:hypothetical protein
MTTTLYKLADDYQRLMDYALDDENEELQNGLSSEFVSMLESLEGEIVHKLEGCCRAFKSMRAMKDAIDDEVAALRLRASRIDRAMDDLKSYMQYNLEQMQMQKITAGIFRLSICKNSQPTVTVLDLDAVPSKFDKPQERQVMLTAIRDAVKRGEDVPGVDVATGKHLRIM